ncbi:MAG: nitrogen regulatory protein P-II 1 [Phycisphaerae bacterium]|nr:MAG: nitrogen regulatory protein P-II 1 [Phycisphaerae bacterium]
MKEIKAIVRQHRLDAVLTALHAHPELPGVTVSYVRGFGRARGRSNSEGESVQYGTAEMVKLECVVNEENVDSILEMIQQAAQTGSVGDGKIFVHDVEDAVKIRTGERLQRLD